MVRFQVCKFKKSVLLIPLGRYASLMRYRKFYLPRIRLDVTGKMIKEKANTNRRW